MKQVSETAKGLFCIIPSAFCFALMAVFVRLSGDIHFVQKAFFRNAVAFFIAVFLLLKEIRHNGVEVISVTKQSLLFLFLRSITGSVGVFGNFYAIDRILLSDAAILNKMAPFFAIIFSFVIMKEKIKLVPLMAIITAFLGSMLIVKPSFDFSKTVPTLAAFAGGMGAGFAYACVRKLSVLKCNSKLIVLFFSAFSMLLSVPYMIVSFNPMSFTQILFLVLAGICAAGGQFSITAAYYHAPARDISIYDYSQLIFSTLLGFIFFAQIPDIYSFIGYIVIISMAVLNFLWNRNQHKIKKNQNKKL